MWLGHTILTRQKMFSELYLQETQVQIVMNEWHKSPMAGKWLCSGHPVVGHGLLYYNFLGQISTYGVILLLLFSNCEM